MIQEIGSIENYKLKMWEVRLPCQTRDFVNHKHVAFEIAYIVSGNGLYTTQTHIHEMNAGDFFVFSSNEIHKITKIAEGGMTLINLHIEPELLFGRSMDSLSAENRNFCFQHSLEFSNHITASNASKLKDIFMIIKSELENQQEEYSLLTKSLLNILLITLIRDYNYTTRSGANPKHAKALQTALKYINTHITERLTLEEVAQIAHITPNYFSALFHDFFNIRFQDYINTQRIDLAKRYLTDSNSDLTILDIAAHCGFNNSANFNKAFRKHTGLTPNEYRSMQDSLIQ